MFELVAADPKTLRSRLLADTTLDILTNDMRTFPLLTAHQQ